MTHAILQHVFLDEGTAEIQVLNHDVHIEAHLLRLGERSALVMANQISISRFIDDHADSRYRTSSIANVVDHLQDDGSHHRPHRVITHVADRAALDKKDAAVIQKGIKVETGSTTSLKRR